MAIATPVPPAAPVVPLGIVKFSVAADEVPTLVTIAELPAAPVVTVPTAIVAAAPPGPRRDTKIKCSS